MDDSKKAQTPEKRSFGYYVFDEAAMEKHLPAAAFKKMKQIIRRGGALDASLADSVAFGMKEWAMGRGASCFSHWFQPLTGRAAHKYDAFLTLKDHLGGHAGGRSMLSQFTGRQLAQGESDGSSFPSGGLRRTSQARGYTGWDITSPPFVVVGDFSGCLYIPAVFCSIFGLSLDQRTPMLKSERSIGDAALRALRLISSCMSAPSSPGLSSSNPAGDGQPRAEVTDVYVTVGAEQEMFIIDREMFKRRPDLVECGRLLLGGPPDKGQQLEDHYWANVPLRVRKVLTDTQGQLWELGVPVTTAHNEVAPAQFEMASNYERASVASDHNMVLMQILEEKCEEQGLSCLFHEKPLYKFVNGSGKHLNWSLATNTGDNLLLPSDEPKAQVRFLFFLAAFIRAVHVHADVLRVAIAVPGNEFRLGGMEAPPAILSVFLGDHLGKLVESIISGQKLSPEKSEGVLDLGIGMPKLMQDSSDRNRTSPVAFVGNRFEFRAVGSSQNVAWPLMALNTIVADSLSAMSDEVESAIASGAQPSKSLAIQKVIRDTLTAHRAIVYNGDCYTPEFIEGIAKERGLPNIPTTPAALELWNSPKNRALFSMTNVMNDDEIEARGLVLAEFYSETRALEARTLAAMVDRQVIPAAIKCQGAIAQSIAAAAAVLGADAAPALAPQKSRLAQIVRSAADAQAGLDRLRAGLAGAQHAGGDEEALKIAHYYHDVVMTAMEALRGPCDTLEALLGPEFWPFPTISDICAFF